MDMRETLNAILSNDPARRVKWNDLLNFFAELDGNNGHACFIKETRATQGIIYVIELDDKPTVLHRYSLSNQFVDKGNLKVIRGLVVEANLWGMQ